MKHSFYNIIYKVKKRGYLIFNTLNQVLVFISYNDYSDFLEMNIQNPNYIDWVNQGLIVDKNTNEYQEKLNKLNVNCGQIITLFTTTTCNARCDYCFESGIKTLYMTESQAQQIAHQIIKSISANRLHISWFGGEPLLNTKAIDTITSIIKPYCETNNIKYTASVITNGSLIDNEIISKIKNDWNVLSVQITLDGTKKKYNKIKNYADKSNFDKVINNIKRLSEQQRVTIRVNFNKNNLRNCLKLVKYLNKIGLTREKIYLYFAPISFSFKNKNELNKLYKKIFFDLVKYGYIKSLSYFNFHLAKTHCQADQPNSFCIFPNGNVSKCQRERPEFSTVSIFEDNWLNKLNNNFTNQKEINNFECNKCKILPLCCYGCKIQDQNILTKYHCERCFMYADCMPAIMECLEKIYLKRK